MKLSTSLILSYLVSFAEAVPPLDPWSIQKIIDTCTDHSNRLCDPSGIISEDDEKRVREEIEHLESVCSVNCANSDENDKVPNNVQMVIVIVPKIPDADITHATSIDKAVKTYATTLHDRWGVGNVICGRSTGILLFLSTYDRSMYVSTSDGVQPILTTSRLESIMDEMKSRLREKEYAEALGGFVGAVEGYFAKGPPSFLERYFVFMLILGVIITRSVQLLIEKCQRREYALVHSQLSKMDRDKALVLMGQYKCTSCPICLEDFQLDKNATRKDTYIGSDGKPPQLLKCGHAFDVTCWNDWISKGSAAFNVRKCPICKQDINGSSPLASPSSSLRPLRRRDVNVASENSVNDSERAIIRQRSLYNNERNFRLRRLMARYPRYIRPSQLERWTRSNHDGDLVRDEEFVRRDPRTEADGTSSSGYGGGNSQFGGGSSSGGAGGSW